MIGINEILSICLEDARTRGLTAADGNWTARNGCKPTGLALDRW